MRMRRARNEAPASSDGKPFGAAGAYWEPKVNAYVSTVQPGGFSVTRRSDLVLATLLGSCVSACICDFEAGIGGLNHFLLPDDRGAGGPAEAAQRSLNAHSSRYGVHAMEMLINEILKLGGARSRLQAKLFGGANVISLSTSSPVGERNQAFTADFLRREGIPVTAADMGGAHARRVFFKPSANKVLVQVLGRSAASQVRQDEAQLHRQVDAAPKSGGVELF
jgi:chemotaxis protein CheD